ncbi:MAG: tetratricopeptide repeat protein [Ferruginibacter sp.]
MPKLLSSLSLLIWILFCAPEMLAQKKYTAKDSVEIYALLDKADDHDFKGKMDDAFVAVDSALILSRAKGMKRGEAFALLKIADLKLKKDGTKGIEQLFAEPLAIGLSLKDSFLTGLCHHQKAQYYRDLSQYSNVDKSLSDALKYYREKQEGFYVGLVYNDKGFANDRSGEYEKAVAAYLNAIRVFEQEKSIKEAANSTGNLASTNFKMGNTTEAIRQYKRSAAMRESIGDIKGLAAVYGNLVNVYSSLSEMDSANKYQELSLLYAQKSGVKNRIALSYANAATLLSKQNKIKEALEYEMKAIVLYTETGDKTKIAARHTAMGILYDKLKDSANAEQAFGKALAVANDLNNKAVFHDIYLPLADFYNSHGNYKKAYEYYRLHNNYKDSILSEKTTANANELQAKYESVKKDNEIARLETEQKIKQLSIEKQNAIITGNKQEAQKKETQIQLLHQQQQLRDAALAKQKEELEKQLLLNKTSEQQLLLSKQGLQLAENEKKLNQRQIDREKLIRNSIMGGALLLLLIGGLLFNRYKLRKKIDEQNALLAIRNKISKDLHDEIGSTLTSINILSNVSQQAMQTSPAEAMEMMHQIAEQSKTIQQNMSDIVWSIRPDTETIENLETRMREYAAQTLEPLGIATSFNFQKLAGNEKLPMASRKDLLLIYKEAVNNIVKHAKASSVNISLDHENHHMELLIEDNGTWKEGHTTGTGTRSMAQRAAAMGGNLAIDKDNGLTRVCLRVPVP